MFLFQITQSNDPPSVLSLDQSLAVDSQTAVKINEQPQPDTTDSSNSLNVTVQESTSQTVNLVFPLKLGHSLMYQFTEYNSRRKSGNDKCFV